MLHLPIASPEETNEYTQVFELSRNKKEKLDEFYTELTLLRKKLISTQDSYVHLEHVLSLIATFNRIQTDIKRSMDLGIPGVSLPVMKNIDRFIYNCDICIARVHAFFNPGKVYSIHERKITKEEGKKEIKKSSNPQTDRIAILKRYFGTHQHWTNPVMPNSPITESANVSKKIARIMNQIPEAANDIQVIKDTTKHTGIEIYNIASDMGHARSYSKILHDLEANQSDKTLQYILKRNTDIASSIAANDSIYGENTATLSDKEVSSGTIIEVAIRQFAGASLSIEVSKNKDNYVYGIMRGKNREGKTLNFSIRFLKKQFGVGIPSLLEIQDEKGEYQPNKVLIVNMKVRPSNKTEGFLGTIKSSATSLWNKFKSR